MADINATLQANLAAIKTFNALASPTTAQIVAELKLINQCVELLIFQALNHPSDPP
jgi:hypothetical protein